MKIFFFGQIKFNKIQPFFFIFLFHFIVRNANAQCGTFISAFPYNEGFESTAAWTSGGSNNDWAWGTPAHPTISSAGTGTKAWSVGGLSGSSYSASAQSYLMSPCFDFTSLNYPWISFKIFWETEFKYDGMVLQYSLNSGSTWTNLGAYNDPVDCLNDNWFNYNNITWLTSASPKHGWSGRIGLTSGSCQGGNGSVAWITAKHCMSALANEPNVRFRFLFGSGTTCNSFDGVAIDDILIQDAAPNTANFSFACTSSNTVAFTNLSNVCSTGYLWNFGDPASGASNTSTLLNPTHTFSAAGNYTITLTSNGPCNAPGIFTQTISVLSNSISSTNVSCFGGSNGLATATATATSYSWNTTPIQTTQTATGLVAGSYVVTISDPSACSTTATIVITQPTPISISFTNSPSCSDVCNGSVGMVASGGISPYTYSWSSLGLGQNFNNTVCLGTYTGSVIDANGCTNMNSTLVDTIPSPIIFCDDANICIGATALLSASGALTYEWSPPIGLSDTTGASVMANPTVTTIYSVTGTSANGCSNSTLSTVTVNNIVSPVAEFSFNPHQADVFNPEINFTNLTNGTNTYLWNFGGINSSTEENPTFIFPIDSGGVYSVCLIAENNIGCSSSICYDVIINGFVSIYVPNAFTPNGDGTNELFFPVLRDVSSQNYDFKIFDRWGQLVFSSTSLEATWDGTFHGTMCKDGVYICKIKYTEQITGVNKEFIGHFSLLK